MPPAMLDLYTHRADLIVTHFEQNLAELYPDLKEAFTLVRREPAAFAALFERSFPALRPASGHPLRS